MKSHLYFLSIILLITSCKTDRNLKQPSDFIPENATYILKVSNLESLKSNLNNNDLLKKTSETNVYKKLSNIASPIQHFNTNDDVLLCFANDTNDSLQYSIITKYHPSLFNIDSLPDIKVETVKTKSNTYRKTTINNETLYSVIKDSIFIGASNKDFLEQTINIKKPNQELVSLLDSSGNNSQLSVLINNKQNKETLQTTLNDTTGLRNFTNYFLLDVDLQQDDIFINGITKATDSTKSLINVFKNTKPQENQLANITPANSDGFLSFTFDNYNTLKQNLQHFHKKDSLQSNTLLFDNVIETGVIYYGNDQAVVLNSLDETSTQDALSENELEIETYRQVPIYSFNKPELFYENFTPFINYKSATKYCIIDTFFIFSDSIELLQNIIASHQNSTTLNDRSYYDNIKSRITDEASLMFVSNNDGLKTFIETHIGESIGFNLDNYKSTVIQYIYDSNFSHVNAVIQKGKTKAVENSISESFSLKLSNNILNTPQFVTNHLTHGKDIVVQDIKNNLYLISNTGKVLWKKQLDGAVLGKIEQIDMYKNGRLQLAFATPNRVYVLDRNGKDVSPFPLKFNDNITQPLSVFDYDNNRNHRLLITQGKNILMYDDAGKTVKGFTFKNADDVINHQPQHIRIGRKDYILVKTDNKLHILDRTGKTRVQLKNSYSYSSEAVYLYNGKFTTTSKNGALITIDTQGNTASQNINLTDLHHITSTSKTLVAQSENKLTIKSKTLEMDYGNYSKPEIYYINDKIYVAITDLQSKKIYLFDSQAKSISNFPVYGNSKIELDNIDSDRNLEFVTKGDDNSILLYQIN